MPKTYTYHGKEISENDLILLIRSGETEGYSLFCSAYLPVIHNFINSINCSETDREDFSQIGLLALCGAIDAYDFISSSFSTFATLCIKRAIISELRRLSTKKQIPSSLISDIEDVKVFDEKNPEAFIIDKESTTVLTDKIKLSLSSFEYKVLNSYLKLGSYLEVAESLGVSVKEVNNALQRSRKKIKKSIGNNR